MLTYSLHCRTVLRRLLCLLRKAAPSLLDFVKTVAPGPRPFATWEEYETRLAGGKGRMGTLILPPVGDIYADANALIYSVQQHPVYAPVLAPLGQAQQAGRRIVSSELTRMETLVLPIRLNDTTLIADYRRLFQQQIVDLLPITSDYSGRSRPPSRHHPRPQNARRPPRRHCPSAWLHSLCHQRRGLQTYPQPAPRSSRRRACRALNPAKQAAPISNRRLRRL